MAANQKRNDSKGNDMLQLRFGGPFPRNCGRKDNSKGKGGDECEGHAKGKGKTMNGMNGWTCGRNGRKSAGCRWESMVSRRKMPTAEEMEDNLNRGRREVGGVWVPWNVVELEDVPIQVLGT